MANNNDVNPVNTVTLRLPTFWSQQPRVWFAQAEAQFTLRNVTADTTKFHYVVASLDQDTAVRILDIIEMPPEENKFTAIKTRLLDSFAPSEYERASRLLHMSSVGDEKPSALMDRMLSLLSGHPPCFLFRQLFLERLPEDIRGPLVHGKLEDCRELAKAADLLWQARSISACTVRSATLSSSKKTTRSFSDIRKTWVQKQGGPCLYHDTYGENANKCILPCSAAVTGNGQAGRQ